MIRLYRDVARVLVVTSKEEAAAYTDALIWALSLAEVKTDELPSSEEEKIKLAMKRRSLLWDMVCSLAPPANELDVNRLIGEERKKLEEKPVEEGKE